MRRAWPAAALLVAAGASAGAQEAPRFCPNRPDLGASTCTTLPGEVQVELSGVDWTADRRGGTREDRVGYGDTLVRLGVGAATELQAQWTPFVTVRTRAGGAVSTRRGVDDVRLAVRQSIANSDGAGLSFAIEPFAVLPVGRSGIGDGDWSAGVQVPVSYELAPRWDLGFTGQASAQADGDGRGRHLNLTGVVGLGHALSDAVGVTGEIYVERDEDPAGAATLVQAAASLAWQPGARTQLDVLAVAGLNRDTPDLRLVLGGAWLF